MNEFAHSRLNLLHRGVILQIRSIEDIVHVGIELVNGSAQSLTARLTHTLNQLRAESYLGVGYRHRVLYSVAVSPHTVPLPRSQTLIGAIQALNIADACGASAAIRQERGLFPFRKAAHRMQLRLHAR